MPARALVVLLLMLNLGVAAWWMLRPDPVPAVPRPVPEGATRLRLLSEVTGGTPLPPSAAPPPDAAEPGNVAATGVDASAIARCLSFGPFADATATAAAQTALEAAGAVRIVPREVTSAPRGWRVILPPLPDRATADATAARIREAGFDDLLVVPAGEDANAIALGRYGAESSARQRATALRAAGFAAEAQPVGVARISTWLDAAVAEDFDPGRARAAGPGTDAGTRACAALQPGAAR